MANGSHTPKADTHQRICRNCNVTLPEAAHRSIRYCSIECKSTAETERRHEKYRAGLKYYPRTPIGFCRRCGNVFKRTSSRKTACDTCRPIIKKEYNAKSPRDQENLRAWQKANLPKANARKRLRRKTSPSYALNGRMGCSVRRALRDRKAGKSWEVLVGYTLADLVFHIERQFKRGMSWGNMEKWHVDHIVPLSSFSYDSPDDPDFKAAWALSNLRPLWALENMQKNAKITHLL